jgi:hypothetical protein
MKAIMKKVTEIKAGDRVKLFPASPRFVPIYQVGVEDHYFFGEMVKLTFQSADGSRGVLCYQKCATFPVKNGD